MKQNKEHQHGGDIYSLQQPIDLDYSVNLNPLGMPAEIQETLCAHISDYMHYPDSQCRALRMALSQWEAVPAQWILCGNGAADLLLRICQAVRPRRTLLLAPTFSEYEKAARLGFSKIRYYQLQREQQFAVQPDILEVLTRDLDLCFLCNPNNPTGQVIDAELLHQIVQRCARQNIILVVDECFLDFTEAVSCKQWLADNPQLLIVKAFTKLFAMAGLRLGYVLTCNDELRAQIELCGQSWSVSAPAQYAGIAACQLPVFVQKTKQILAAERFWLEKQLQILGMDVVPGQGNFICFRAPVPLWQPLLQKGILVRSCANYQGLDDLDYRICVKLRSENEKLLQALREVCYGESNHDSRHHV